MRLPDRLSASRLWLAFTCTYWLRDDMQVKEEKQSYAARLGSALHKAFELYINTGSFDVHAVMDEYELTPALRRRFMAALQRWLDWYLLLQAEEKGRIPEVAYAYHPPTRKVRRLKQEYHRDYRDAHDDELVGSVDLVGDGYVGDWKSGRWVDDPYESAQLRYAAVCRWREDKTQDVIKAELIKVSDVAPVMPLTAHLPVFSLSAFEGKLLKLHKTILSGDLRASEGEWCRRCPAKQVCPYSTAKKEAA